MSDSRPFHYRSGEVEVAATETEHGMNGPSPAPIYGVASAPHSWVNGVTQIGDSQSEASDARIGADAMRELGSAWFTTTEEQRMLDAAATAHSGYLTRSKSRTLRDWNR